MKRKKLVSMLMTVVLTVSAVCLAGCKEGGSGKGNKGDGETGDVVEITVCDLISSATGANRWKAMRQKQFEKDHPEIKVKHVSTLAGDTTNMVEYLTTIFMGDNSPVYYDVSSISFIRDLYNSDLAADISPYLTEDSSYYKMYDYVQEAVRYNDAVIGYPSTLEVPLLGFYNENLKEAGYDPATFTCETWEKYMEAAKKMTKSGVAGASLYVYEYYLWPANWFISNGAEPAVQNEDGTISLDFTNQKFVETLEFFKELYEKGYTNNNITYTQLTDMMTLIQNKKLASFTFYPTWLTQFQSWGIEADEITLLPFPKGPSYKEGEPSSNVIVAGTVFNSRKSPEEIKAGITYFEYMNGEESQKDFQSFVKENKVQSFTISPYPSIDWKSALEGQEIPESWIAGTQTALEEAYVTPLRSNAFTTYLTVQFGNIVRGEVDMLKALKDAQRMAENEWLEGFNSYLKE